MRKKILLCLIGITSTLSLINPIISNATTLKNIDTTNFEENISNQKNDLIFENTNPEIINTMKSNLELQLKNNQTNTNSNIETKSWSSLIASGLDIAGFKSSAHLLNYSMKPLRPEPLIIEWGYGTFVSDMWNYSPDFENAVVRFLNNARGKNEYFSTVNINFTMPNASKPTILANTALKRQTDLFGAFHGVRLNLGVVKDGSKWHVLALVEDRYDFEKAQYNGLVDLVNNIVNHEQELGKVKPYDVMVYADRPNLSTLPYGVRPW